MLSFQAWRRFSPARSGETCARARYALSMEPREDSWESWEAGSEQPDDLDRGQVKELARRLAAQRADDLAQLDELKRALRERAADVARRELDVERRTRELEEAGGPSRRARPSPPAAKTPRPAGRRAASRGGGKPQVDEDRAYADELIARRETDVEERTRAVEARERELAERETAVLARKLELDEREPKLAERERDVSELRSALEQQAAELKVSAAELDSQQQALAETRAELDRLGLELADRTAALEKA